MLMKSHSYRFLFISAYFLVVNFFCLLQGINLLSFYSFILWRLVQVILNHNNSHLHSCLFLLQMVGNLVLILPATITTSNPMWGSCQMWILTLIWDQSKIGNLMITWIFLDMIWHHLIRMVWDIVKEHAWLGLGVLEYSLETLTIIAGCELENYFIISFHVFFLF